MFLLNALGRLLGFVKDEQNQGSHNPPFPSSRSPPQDGLSRDEPPAPLPPVSFTESTPLVPQSKASSSNNPSLATVSSTKISISEDRIPPSSSSTSLPLSKRDTISPAPPIHILSANNSVAWQKNKQISTELSREIPKYEIPKNLEEMIRNDTVPPVLISPLCPSTYSDYFATLLYAEDFYVEKWSNYLLKGIELKLHHITNSKNSLDSSMKRKNTMQDHSDYVGFEIDSVPERRPFLLSRDFVFLKPLNEIAGPFKGILFRVVKSTTVLVEFGDDFHSQHFPSKRYDVSFSFNRVCLKRAHQAISVASDSSFHHFLFPDKMFPYHPNTSHMLHGNKLQFQDHVKRICNHNGNIPYLVNGQLVLQRSPHHQTDHDTHLSSTSMIIQEAMLNIYRSNPRWRILVCSPTNKTSDVILRSLKNKIPESRLFRANAAYRNYNHVPNDIIPSSLYEEDEDCFACPPLAELLDFDIITCTFMSSFRLFAAGIVSGHFTHIFLLDASLAIEPEAIVPLVHLADRQTIIVVSGCAGKSPNWVRADIARWHGLQKSYFDRLLEMEPYRRNDSMFIAHLA